MLAVLGFMVFTAQQMIQASLDADRDKLVSDIVSTVSNINEVVNNIAGRLTGVAIETAGTPLLTVRDDPEIHEAEEIEAMAKGSSRFWKTYAAWLGNVRHRDNTKACLSLTLNRGHNYYPGLIQGYLLTDTPNSEVNAVLKNAVFSDVGYEEAWDTFPQGDFVEEYGVEPPIVDCVLFYDQEELVAFADAAAFVKELYFLQRRGRHAEVKDVLNNQNPRPQRSLQELFASLRIPISHESDVSEIAKTMLNEKMTEIVVVHDKNYVVRLMDLIELARKST